MSPVGAADIARQVLIQGLDVAPDGSFAVYGRRTVEDGKYAARLWRVGFDRGARPERLTNGPSDAAPRISPDGRSLLFLGARADDAPPAPWILPLAGGEPAQVAEFPGPTVFADWSADGTQIVVLAASGDQRFVVGDAASPVARAITDLTWRLDGMGIRDQFMSAWVVPAAGGKPTRLTSGHETFGVFWAPDGKRIGFLADRTDDAALIEEPRAWAVSTSGGGRPRELPGPRTVTAAAWSPDGRTLALLGNDELEPAGWALEQLYVADRAGVRQLAGKLDRPMRNQTIADLLDFSSVFTPTLRWLDDTSLLTIVGDRGCAHPYRVRLDGTYERLAGGPIVTTGAASGGGRLAVVATDRGRPSEVYAVENGELRALTRDGSRWLGARRLDPELVELPRRGSAPALDAWLVRARSGRGRRPLVLTIHGGPFGSYGPTPSLPYLALADAGIHVMYANPRGSTGYGETFARELEGAWGETDAPDLLRCVDWAVRTGLADPRRIGVMGISYGGYMTNWLLGHHPNRFAAGISENPVTNLISFFGTSDFGWFATRSAAGVRNPQDDWARLLRFSPATELPRFRGPVLFIHADGDLRCPPEQTELAFAMLRMLGRPVEMVRYPDESHGVSILGRPDRRADRLQRIVRFFDEHL
ncbi:MAG: S9 family peptidase [Thermoleophilia bacterium]